MIDTLKIYSRLKNKGIQEEAANEIAEIFNEIVNTELSTKSDIAALKISTKSDIEALAISTKSDIEKLKIEFEKKIVEIKAEILKWIAGMLIGQAALITTLMKLLCFPIKASNRN